jgi:hypothetical protein
MPHDALALLPGTVDLLILRALQTGPAHGYTITRWVRERTDGVLTIEDAALYQALHRIRRCTGSKPRDPSQPSGGFPTTTGAPSTTASPRKVDNSSGRRLPHGKRYSTAMLRIVEPA